MPVEKPLGVLVYILVEDIDEALKRVEGLGGKIILPKSPCGENTFRAVFADPDGNTLALWQNP